MNVEFTPPKGFIPPEVSEHGEFDLVCTFRAKSGGQICLVQLGDTKMPGYDKDEGKQQAAPDYKGYATQMQSEMGGAGGNPAGESGGY